MAEWQYPDLRYERKHPYVRLSFPLNHTRPDYEPLLHDSISRLARILYEEFTDLLLAGDSLKRLSTELARQHEELARDRHLRSIRHRAQAAFKAGDWQTVIDLYWPMLQHVDRSERMKVDYARRRLAEEGG